MDNIKRNEAVRRLADAFKGDFAEFCAGHDKMHELMMDLAGEFAETNIPITDEDATIDTAYELLMSVTVREV